MCGQVNPDGFRFCGGCGTPLGSGHVLTEERRVVTVLFCDLVGFTARSDQADPEDIRALLRPYHLRLRTQIERLGGTLDKFIGDGVMGVFGVPVVHEDDPERAVRCALRMLDAIAELNTATPGLDLAVRIGIMTGEAAVILASTSHDTESVVGDVVNTASRLEAVAPTGGVVVGEPTWRATRALFHYQELDAVRVKGKAKPLRVWHAVAPRGHPGVEVHQRPTTLFLGRDEELDRLRGLYHRTLRERVARRVTIVGEPGIGKSRLVRELLAFVDGRPELVIWRQGRCLPYGDGVTFWALGEIVKTQAGVLASDDAALAIAKLEAAVAALVTDADEREWLTLRLRPLLGLSADDAINTDQAESFTAWARFLVGVAADRLLILVIEDLHWADPALLAFLEHVLRADRGVGLLLVTTARPELLERHPAWARDEVSSTVIPLAALGDDDTARLIASLLGRSKLPDESWKQLLDRADGNPLYAEEYVHLLADQGLLTPDSDERRLALDTDRLLPPTLQALIAARLDLLRGDRKVLLQDAAVIGKVFWSGALAAMAGFSEETVKAELGVMERAELVRAAKTSTVHGQAQYAFWHDLVRDVAYAQIPRAERARRHQAAAAWIEALTAERVADHAELLAHDYTKALELARLAQLAEVEIVELEEGARRSSVLAGQRALHLDIASAISWYEQALSLHPAEHPGRAAVLARAAEAARQAGRLDDAERRYHEAVERFRAQGESLSAGGALLGFALVLRARGETARARGTIAEALRLLQDHPTSVELAGACTQMAFFELVTGRSEQSMTWVDKALAIGAVTDIGEHEVRALELRGLARCELGDLAGLDDVRAALKMALDLGFSNHAVSIANNLGEDEWPVQGPAAALKTLDRGIEFARRRGLEAAAMHLRASALGPRFDLGEWDELLRLAEEVRSWSATHGEVYIHQWTQLRQAEVLLHRGEVHTAATLAARFLPDIRTIGDLEILAPALTVAALIEQARGRSPAAVRLVDELVVASDRHSGWQYAQQLLDLVRIYVVAGRVEVADDLVRRMNSPAPRHRYSKVTAQAVMAEARNDLESAAHGYQEAAVQWTTYGHALEAANAHLSLGRCMILMHRLEAQNSLRQAQHGFSRLAARPLLAQTNRLLRQSRGST